MRILKGLLVSLFASNINNSEVLCRYIFSKSHYSSKNNITKYGAFMPDPKNGESSVFRINFPPFIKPQSKKVWDIGINFVARLRGKQLKARADFPARFIREESELKAVSEPYSHYLHANLVGWADDKPDQMGRALELVDQAQLHILKQ